MAADDFGKIVMTGIPAESGDFIYGQICIFEQMEGFFEPSAGEILNDGDFECF